MNPANPNNLRQVKAVPVGTELVSLARVPGTSKLWAGGRDFKLYHVDLAAATPQVQALEGHASYVSGVVLTDRHVISAGWDKQLIWWDLESKRRLFSIQAHGSWIRQLAITPDRQTLVTVADDLVCRLWDSATGEKRRELTGHAETVPANSLANKLYACAVSSDGRYVAASDFGGRVIVWDVATGGQAGSFAAPIFYKSSTYLLGWCGLRALAFSPDDTLLALAGMENTDPYITQGNPLVRIYNWRTEEQAHEMKVGRDFQFESVCFSHRGDWMTAAAGCNRAHLAFYELAGRRVVKELTPPSQIFALALGENSETLYGAGRHFVQWELKG